LADKLSKKILKEVKGGSTANKVMEALSLPQRILMRKAAEKMGVPSGKTSEESAFNIVNEFARRQGLPEDSDTINALKAGAVATLETFADPLGPIGKLSKFMKLKRLKAAAKGATNTLDRWKDVAGKRVAAKKPSGKNTKELWAERKAASTTPQPKKKTTQELWEERGGKKAEPLKKSQDTKSAWAGKKEAMEKAVAKRKSEGLPTTDTGQFVKTLDRDKHVVSALKKDK
jgi:hypothetical protein